MTPIPALCDNGHVYILVDGPIEFGPTVAVIGDVGLEGSYGCPKCGAPGRMLPGTASLSQTTFQLLSGPKWSIDALGRIVEEVRLAQAGQLSAEDVVAHITDHDPQLGELLRKLGKLGLTVITILGFVLAAIEFVQSQETSTELNELLHRQRVGQTTAQAKHPPKRPKRPAKTHGKNKRRKRK